MFSLQIGGGIYETFGQVGQAWISAIWKIFSRLVRGTLSKRQKLSHMQFFK